MPHLFSDKGFRTYPIERVPLSREFFLMDEKWMRQYEQAMLDVFKGQGYRCVGDIAKVAVRKATTESLELAWFPNTSDRFHEMCVFLPGHAFRACVDCPDYEDRPRIFVDSAWFSGIHRRPNSAFALVDAVGTSELIRRGGFPAATLARLRDRMDVIAAETSGVSFVSFADSVLLKSNWFIGDWGTEVAYSYQPEGLLRVIPRIRSAFREDAGLDSYAVVVQGVNEYEDASLLHISPERNHVSLNSLGLPFAQLQAIDQAARGAIRENVHGRSNLYLDEHYYLSLRIRDEGYRRSQPSFDYRSPISSRPGKYYPQELVSLLSQLKVDKESPHNGE